jgi:hypothetical protein
MQTILLSIHLLFSGLTAIAVLTAGFAFIAKKPWLANLFTIIAWLGFGDIFSGSLLSVIAKQSVAAFCANISLYLLVIAAVETGLWFATRKNHSVSMNPIVRTSLLSGISIALAIIILV